MITAACITVPLAFLVQTEECLISENLLLSIYPSNTTNMNDYYLHYFDGYLLLLPCLLNVYTHTNLP